MFCQPGDYERVSKVVQVLWNSDKEGIVNKLVDAVRSGEVTMYDLDVATESGDLCDRNHAAIAKALLM